MPSGWTRLIFENFEFPYEVVFPPDLDAGNLNAKFDVLVFNDSPMGGGGGGRGGGAERARASAAAAAGAETGAAGAAAGAAAAVARRAARGPDAAAAAARASRRSRFRKSSPGVRAGHAARSTKIRQFVEAAARVIGIGSSADGLIQAFELPLTNHLVETAGRSAAREVLRARLGAARRGRSDSNPLAHGYGKEVDVFFDNNPVWRRCAGGAEATSARVAWFASPTPLRSGWAWGQQYLDKGIQMAETTVGKGRVLFLSATELLFRSQPHGTYRLFFNGLYLSVADGMKAGMGQ